MTDGSALAVPDRCPHREAPLSIGHVDGGRLVCAYHGWTFADGGRCVEIPSSGEGGALPRAAHLGCCPTTERYGLVWVCPGEPRAVIPEVPHDRDPAFRRINTGVEVWQTSATRMVDNFLDISHFPWVHTGTFGAGQATEVLPIELEQLDDDFFGFACEVDANNPEEAVVTSGCDEEVVHRWMTTGYSLPFLVRSTIRYADGLEHILLLCSTPVDDVTSYFTFVVWRNDDFSIDGQEVIAFDRAIGAEDKVMLEQIPGPLPLSETDLVSVGSDKPSVEWRRRLLEVIT
ncbi:MAG: Rieske 2Fe-2S domain-containing protein [Actinomycetia bacterium]|nr:Rieske 2Fe-2S domain-containing protein [Actinomycetes bacterium]